MLAPPRRDGVVSPVPDISGEPSSVLSFLHIIQRLKLTPRTGWVNHGIANPESCADHMYRMAIICMLCTDPTLDRDRCVKIALVHDMAESLVGDITPLDSVTKEEKHRREMKALHDITSHLLPDTAEYVARGQELRDLFMEYETQSSREAQFVKDVDKYELLVQMLEFEKQEAGTKDLSQFTAVQGAIRHPIVRQWAEELFASRRQFWESVGKQPSVIL